MQQLSDPLDGRASGAATLPATYTLPMAPAPGGDLGALVGYVRQLARWVDEVVVVDGSTPAELERHRLALAQDGQGEIIVLPPDADARTPMGKVGAVLTGVRRARCERLVVADDDVRYDLQSLAAVVELLEVADVVRPHNYFTRLPWHARIDTARSLLNRVFGGDWPGTLGVRRSVLEATGGYAGDVMFENLELVRTVRAAGGRELVALDVFVGREPPTTRHFWSQRVRQAYDELARPARLAVFVAVLPVLGAMISSRCWRAVAALLLATTSVAEMGRRRAGGGAVLPASSSLLAPVWLVERGFCVWPALAARLRGGIRYRGRRLRWAATPRRLLAARVAEGTAGALARG